MIQLSSLTKSFGDRVLLDRVTWQIDDRERVGLSGPERRRQDDAAQDARRARRARRRRDRQAVGPDDRLPAAGRPDSQRPHAARRSRPRVQAAARHARRDRRRSKSGSATTTRRRGRARGDARALQRAAGGVPAPRRLQHRPEDHDRAARPRLLARATSTSRRETFSGGWQMRIALAKLLLGRPGPAAARRADEPPRSRRAQLARGVPRPTTRTPSSSSRTIASSSTRSSRASPRSGCAR